MLNLYIVATPIGNLEDITYRAVKTLEEADFILCEDTRKTKVLLDKYEIKKPLKAYHQQSHPNQIQKILNQMSEVEQVALVTDAGTPGISDPGNILVEKALEFFGDEIKIVPIPGANAVSALICVAGINTTKFTFLGFPPNKKGREKFFREVLGYEHPVLYYESPYRLMKNLDLIDKLQEELGVSRKIVLGRELTKMFEEIVRGEVEEVEKYYEENGDKVKGEIVVLVFN
jgi:16S rRNA (cytidine1402-2'-O)-methyltransferase